MDKDAICGEPDDELKLIESLCKGKSSCKLPANDDMFGDLRCPVSDARRPGAGAGRTGLLSVHSPGARRVASIDAHPASADMHAPAPLAAVLADHDQVPRGGVHVQAGCWADRHDRHMTHGEGGGSGEAGGRRIALPAGARGVAWRPRLGCAVGLGAAVRLPMRAAGWGGGGWGRGGTTLRFINECALCARARGSCQVPCGMSNAMTTPR